MKFGSFGVGRLELSTRRMSYVRKSTANNGGGAANKSYYSVVSNKSTAKNPLSSIVTASFDRITSAAKDLSVHTNKLQSSSKGNLFEGKDKVDKALTDEIKSFVSDYNALLSAMEGTDNKTYKGYAKELKTQVSAASAELSKIGITYKTDGSLELDTKKLESADISKVRELFNAKDGFLTKVADKSYYIERRVALDKVVSSYQATSFDGVNFKV